MPTPAPILGAAERIYRETPMPKIIRAAKDENFKCGASRTLPLDEDSDWDGAAAQKSIFEACGFDGDKPDLGKAKKAFLAYDASNPKLKGSYKLPFAKIADGRMVAVAAGIRAAASRLPNTDIPDDVKNSARAVIDEYEGKMTKKKDGRALVTKRGLYEISWLCSIMADLNYLKLSIDAEEEHEGDVDSPNPENMLAVVQALAETLTEMLPEELEEMLTRLLAAADGERSLKAFRASAGKLARAKLTKGDKATSTPIPGSRLPLGAVGAHPYRPLLRRRPFRRRYPRGNARQRRGGPRPLHAHRRKAEEPHRRPRAGR